MVPNCDQDIQMQIYIYIQYVYTYVVSYNIISYYIVSQYITWHNMHMIMYV
jgi:hypothetical protein